MENRHKNQRCFVIGSGPSIKKMDLDWLRDEITICVNQSYKALDFDPTYICIGDRELWPKIKDEYASKKSTIICSTGLNGKVCSDYHGDNLGLVVPLDKTKDVEGGHFRHDLKFVVKAYNVIPEIVLPFVFHAGFAKCYLIGCDCTNDGYFYPKAESARPDWPQQVLPSVIPAYKIIWNYAAAHGLTRIYNAGYGGRLDVFERVYFDALRPGAPPPPLVIGYHTPHAEYRRLAANMAASVRAFGLQCEIREYPQRTFPAEPGFTVKNPQHANWVLNCAMKGDFVADMMDEFPGRDLIFLDADAVMEKRPAFYLDGPRDYDFAAPYLTNDHVTGELQSNSLYFAGNAAARRLVAAWKKLQLVRIREMLAGKYKHPFREAWDQKVLQDVISVVAGLRHIALPMTYAKIMPTPTGHEITPHIPLAEAVITQHQASREMRFKA